MIRILINQGSMVTVPMEANGFVFNAALRIFRSVLKGVRIVLKNSSVNYDEVKLCLNKLLGLLKMICEDVNSENSDVNNLHQSSLQFVVAVMEELEPSILGSPLYKVALDLNYIDPLQSVNETKHAEVLGVRFTLYKDMVSPVIYLIILYFYGVLSTLNTPGAKIVMQDACRNFKMILSSFEPSEILETVVSLLYKHVGFDCLKVWIPIAKGLKEYIDEAKDVPLLKPDCDNPRSLAVCDFLSYPFAVCSGPQKQLTTVQSTGLQESSIVSFQSQRRLELEHVIEVSKSLYVSVNHVSRFVSSISNSFAEDLSLALNGCLDDDTKVLGCGTELNSSNNNQDHDLLLLCGNIVICVLEHILVSGVSSTGSKDTDGGDYKRSSGINNSLGLAARFMTLSRTMIETIPPPDSALISRVFSVLVHFVDCLRLKEDILSFVQIMSSPFLQWLSCAEIPCQDTKRQLQLLWTKTLNGLQSRRPPLTFDSSFLKLQAPLLKRTLDHPNPSISEPTITFWNSTYALEKLDYPPNLLSVLDKLSRNGRINLCKRTFPFIGKCNSKTNAPQRYRVSTATQNRSSKRVKLLEGKANGIEDNDKQSFCPKRKRQELTEHQKEVRRAQQGRERDCSGHGPGIRTYTALDFSQGNEESQDSQEIRDAESILEMLSRTG
ncbi:uncharacterized protein LOC130791508 [Actinidia eriantha]|uniref:uncharacterized protein LOC130791508 n=1 Tax=Actinidia eriantha TaxID=165200 RepID=UPI002583F255|nr:uncharacterized protein LOC130791508 [Actinidia eriantha]